MWVIVEHYLSMVLALLQVAGVVLLPPRANVFVGLGIIMYTGSVLLYLAAIESAKRTRLQRSFVERSCHSLVGRGQVLFPSNLLAGGQVPICD